MTNDDFMDGLRADWQSRMADPRVLEHAVREGETRLQRQKWQRLGGLAMFAALTAYFAYQAWNLDSPLFHLGAVAFLVALLITAGEFLFLRRITGADYMAGGASLEEKAEKQAQGAVMLERAAASAAMLLGICATFAAIYAVTGRTNPWTAGLLAVVWFVAAAFTWIHYRRRSTSAEAELEQIRSVRAEREQEG